MIVTRRELTLGIGAGILLSGCSSNAEPKLAAGGIRADLYNCEGCEAVFERPLASMPSRLRLASLEEPGERMLLSGRVTLPDGVTPAANVVIYAHHTNVAGLYANGTPDTEWSRRHGRLRGWAKTGADGRYAFDTIKPAPYPDRSMPAHVHLFLMEPGKRPYYIDDAVFAGEFGVTADYRRKQELRGGSGIVTPTRREGVILATRDIVLERHPG